MDDPVALAAWREAKDRYNPANGKRDTRAASELSATQVMAVIVAHQNGVAAVEIALGLGVAAKDVETLVRQLDAADTREAAKQVILAKALSMAERLMDTTHGPTMLEVMRDLGVTEKKAPVGEQKGGVTVLIGIKPGDIAVQVNEQPLVPTSAGTVQSTRQ